MRGVYFEKLGINGACELRDSKPCLPAWGFSVREREANGVAKPAHRIRNDEDLRVGG